MPAAEPPRRIAITGASSGLGRAVALAYARPGVVLALFGRDTQRLEAVVAACEAAGATAQAVVVDATDRDAMRAALDAFGSEGGIDLLIANAGVSSGRRPDGAPETGEAALRVLEVNVLGVAHAVLPALERMAERGRGQIALVGSLSARPPLASSPAYSASKAAVEAWGSALREAYRGRGVRVSVISPGFVETPMSARVRGPRPLIMSAERAALLIRRGLERDRARIAFPRRLAWPMAIAAALPAPLAARLVRPFAFRVTPDQKAP